MAIFTAAEEQFGPLFEGERRMLATADGQRAVCGANDNDFDATNNPQYATTWETSRTIRSALIVWLCRTGDSFGRTSSSGIHVYGARITGLLNLSYAVIPYPLLFERCAFVEEMSLKNAEVPSLILTGSWTRTILADGIDVANNVLLNKGFCAHGQVLLRDAKIGGGLRTEDATFVYQEGGLFGAGSQNSLGCDRIKVNGSIFLSKPRLGSRFVGEVGLAGALIGSNLECDNSIFENPGGIAIRADRIKVVGAAYLRNGFSAKGSARLLNGQMDVLDCTGGKFEGDGETALTVEAGTISGSCNFEGTVARGGAIQLRGVTAGDVTFRAAELGAIDLRYATIRRALRIKRIRFVDMEGTALDMRNATIDSIDDDRTSWPEKGRLSLDGLKFDRFGSVTSNVQEDVNTCPTDWRSRLDWLQLDNKKPSQPYKNLAKVYSASGETLSVREVLYSLEEMLHQRERESEDNCIRKSARWGWSLWLKSTIGYGHKLMRSLYWLISLCLISWVISYVGYRAKVIVPTDKEAYDSALNQGYVPNNYPRFSATIFTVEHSLPTITFGMSNSWSADISPQDAAHPCLAKWIRIFLVAQRFFGWLLSIFFLAGLTGLVKSDK